MASSTERSQRCRERQRRGVLGLVPVEVTKPVLRRLLADGLVTYEDVGQEELDAQISTALSRLVDAWAQGEYQ